MSIKMKIDEVVADSIVKRVPFTSTYAALKGIGLNTYQVDVKTLEMTYTWGKDEEYKKTPSNAHDFEIAKTFSAKGVKAAIDFHRENSTSYFDFISEITQKGCAKYIVDFQNNQVTYYGKTKSESHVEKIPGF